MLKKKKSAKKRKIKIFSFLRTKLHIAFIKIKSKKTEHLSKIKMLLLNKKRYLSKKKKTLNFALKIKKINTFKAEKKNKVFFLKKFAGFKKHFKKVKYKKKIFRHRKKISLLKSSSQKFLHKAAPLNLYEVLKKFFIKKGKLANTKLSLDAMLTPNKKLNVVSRIKTKLLVFNRLNIKAELRKYSARKRVFFVPFLINIPRQLFLSAKMLYTASLAHALPQPFSKRLLGEVQQMQQNAGKSIDLKLKSNEQCYQNRGNAHFRW